MGRQYAETLRSEVVRLALLADRELDGSVVESVAKKLEPAELQALAQSYARQAGERFPVKVQLTYRAEKRAEEADQAFLV